MFYALIQQKKQMLISLQGLLAKGQTFSDERGYDSTCLLKAQLAPDMYPLIKQIQVACDTAKFAASRLTGKDAPVFKDDERTMEQIVARIKATVEYLDSFSEEDFADSADCKVTLSFMPGVYSTGSDYILQFAIPNFFFHMTIAYSILRSNGVAVGKLDYISRFDVKPIES